MLGLRANGIVAERIPGRGKLTLNYMTRQRLHDLVRRRAAPVAASLLVFLCWALIAVLLYSAAGLDGLLLSLLLLGVISSLGIAYSILWVQRTVRRERQKEAQRNQELAWLSVKLSPRRPLPLWVGGMARTDLLDRARHCVDEMRPTRVLELGSGLSTLVMAYALEANGQGEVFALEDNAAHAIKTRRLLAAHGLDEYAHVLDAPLRSVDLCGERHEWYALDNLRSDLKFELLFVDGPAGHLAAGMRYPALLILRQRIASNAVIFVDDTDRKHESAMVERWLARYPEIMIDDALGGPGFTVLRVADSAASAAPPRSGAHGLTQGGRQ